MYYNEEKICGLTSAEVAERVASGRVNRVKEKAGKSYLGIIADNLLTFFNMVWLVVTVVLVVSGSLTNLSFLFVVIPNILIATVQEIRAKRVVERLRVTTEPRAVVIREGAECEISADEIVIDDIIKIESGHQVLSDGEVVSGYAEANESMLTGESNAIKKQIGDKVLAGSFLVGGAVLVKVTSVGKDNYVHTIESAAKGFKAPVSNLFSDLNSLIKYIGIFMIPMAILMAITNYFDTGFNLTVTVEKTSGSVIGMIPAGIYLLITVTLTLSVMILAKKRTLVQDMYSIEMLASADVVCLDKTGTITDGTMCVTSLYPIGVTEERAAEIIALIEGAEQSANNTSRALIERFGKKDAVVTDRIPFSSDRKYSAASFEGEGCFAIGAPGFAPCEISEDMQAVISERASAGERVLVLAELDELYGRGRVVALVSISDRIRPNAKETISAFQEQGVAIKIISGDHAETVASIAKRVGVENAEECISCAGLSDEELTAVAEKYTVFGRVTPEQKVLLVKALKSAGHVVAMTGDGVNDTLALKEANCAVAMADGSEVARAVSQIVLLDSDFSALPEVVKEGRRCINNVRNSAVLFLMKTIFVIGLSLFAIFVPGMTYPFEPKQFILLELFVIGIPSVLLALEPSFERIKGSFLRTVFVESIPSAIVIYLPVLLIMILGTAGVGISAECRNAAATVVVTLVGYINLVSICHPFTKFRAAVCIGVALALTGAVALSFASPMLGTEDLIGILPAMENTQFLVGVVGIGASLALLLQLFKSSIARSLFAFGDAVKNVFNAKK